MSNTDKVFELAEKYQWREVDNVVRMWVALSGFENDQENYAIYAALQK